MTIRALLPALLIASIVSISGCAAGRKVVLHPIEKADIQPMNKGEAYTPEKDGYFLSSFYLKEVVDAKVEAVKR